MRSWLLALAGMVVVACVFVVGMTMSRQLRPEYRPHEEGTTVGTATKAEHGSGAGVPTGLALPFAVTQIRARDFDVHPFGVVRFSGDQPEYGHSGIDIPLGPDAAIFAVSDGKILDAYPADDDRPGQYVALQIGAVTQPGEAWVFLYEHILLAPEFAVGAPVHRGERIGTTAIPTNYNNHLQLSYAFNGFTYFRDHTCWIEQLASDGATDLTVWFDGLKTTPALQDQWQTYAREGQYELRGLLDTKRFPDGPQLCYPPGTDVRAPVDASTPLETGGSSSPAYPSLPSDH